MRMPDGDDDPAEGALARRAAAAVRGDGVRGRRRSTRHPAIVERAAEFARALRRRRARARPPARARTPTAAGCSRWSTRRGCAGSSPRCSTRRSSSARTASARSRAATSTTRTSSTGTASTTRSATCPAESDTGMFGGNSNWRGPVWFPMNLVILRALLQLHRYYGDDFKIECPTGSGSEMNLREVAAGDRTAARRDVPRGRGRPPAGLRRDREVPDRPALARPAAVLRVLPRRQRRRHRREPPDRLDRHRGAPVHAVGRLPGVRRARCSRRTDGVGMRLPSAPDDLRDQHRGVARAARPRARPAADARRGARPRVGRDRGAARSTRCG